LERRALATCTESGKGKAEQNVPTRSEIRRGERISYENFYQRGKAGETVPRGREHDELHAEGTGEKGAGSTGEISCKKNKKENRLWKSKPREQLRKSHAHPVAVKERQCVFLGAEVKPRRMAIPQGRGKGAFRKE